jgi:methylthioribose-1-phosphate isomerase
LSYVDFSGFFPSSFKKIGAPLIAIVASLGLAVDLLTNPITLEQLDEWETKFTIDNQQACVTELINYITTKINYLRTSRPTAVNLFHAMKELDETIQTASEQAEAEGSPTSFTTTMATHIRQTVCQAVVKHAEFMLRRDVSDNRAIGSNGAKAILQRVMDHANNGESPKVTMITICNTGSLATAGYGTALGVARALQEQDALQQIIALETRPYNQGSRLTAFEMVEEKMPNATLICDSAVGALMKASKKICVFCFDFVTSIFCFGKFLFWLLV